MNGLCSDIDGLHAEESGATRKQLARHIRWQRNAGSCRFTMAEASTALEALAEDWERRWRHVSGKMCQEVKVLDTLLRENLDVVRIGRGAGAIAALATTVGLSSCGRGLEDLP